MLSTAPAQGSERGPATDDLWSYFGMANEPSSWSTDTAGVLLSYFEASTARDRRQRAQHSFAWAAALSGLPAIPSGCLWRLAVSIDQAPPMPQDLNQQPPALPLLAVRAARNALAQNPEDGNAYLYLGRAYLDLVSRTPERSALGLLAPLVELRHIQIAVALENALRRNPDSLAAHEDLAVLYEGRGFLDAALQHRRAAVRLGRLAGPIPGEDASTFARRLEQGEQAVAFMERRLREKKNEFALRTQNLGSEPYRKAETALSMGLALLALDDILMSTSPVLLGGEGVRLQVRLQMMLGRLDLVRSQLHSPDWQTYKANLGFVTLGTPGNSSAPAFRLPAYEWLLLCQAAADGDYHRAEAIVKPLYNEAEAAVKSGLEIAPTQQLALIVSELRSKMAQALVRELALSSVSQSGLLVTMAHLLRLDTMQMFHRISVPTRELAKDRVTLQLIAGLLALERGQLQAAEAAFKEALTWSHRAPDDLATGMAASLAKTYLRSLTSSPR